MKQQGSFLFCADFRSGLDPITAEQKPVLLFLLRSMHCTVFVGFARSSEWQCEYALIAGKPGGRFSGQAGWKSGFFLSILGYLVVDGAWGDLSKKPTVSSSLAACIDM